MSYPDIIQDILTVRTAINEARAGKQFPFTGSMATAIEAVLKHVSIEIRPTLIDAACVFPVAEAGTVGAGPTMCGKKATHNLWCDEHTHWKPLSDAESLSMARIACEEGSEWNQHASSRMIAAVAKALREKS